MTTKTFPDSYLAFEAPNPERISAQKWVSSDYKSNLKDSATVFSILIGLIVTIAGLGVVGRMVENEVITLVISVVCGIIVGKVCFDIFKKLINSNYKKLVANERIDLAKVLSIVEKAGWSFAKPVHQGMAAEEHFLHYGEGAFVNADGIEYYLNGINFSKECVYGHFALTDLKVRAEQATADLISKTEFRLEQWEEKHGSFATDGERDAFRAGISVA